MRKTRQNPSQQLCKRTWECIWEDETGLHYAEVQVSVFITEPEVIAAKAGIPEGCPRHLVPKLTPELAA